MNENDLKNQQLELSTFRKTLREIDWFLRSKRPIIYLTTPEEQRIEDGIKQVADAIWNKRIKDVGNPRFNNSESLRLQWGIRK